MTQEALVAFCTALGGAPEYPFGPGVLVMRAANRRCFCFIWEGSRPLHIGLKCDPGEAEILRLAHPAIRPGYHLNKRHWNSVYMDGSIPAEEIRRMARNAYLLVTGRRGEMTPLRPPGSP